MTIMYGQVLPLLQFADCLSVEPACAADVGPNIGRNVESRSREYGIHNKWIHLSDGKYDVAPAVGAIIDDSQLWGNLPRDCAHM